MSGGEYNDDNTYETKKTGTKILDPNTPDPMDPLPIKHHALHTVSSKVQKNYSSVPRANSLQIILLCDVQHHVHYRIEYHNLKEDHRLPFHSTHSDASCPTSVEYLKEECKRQTATRFGDI